MEGVHAQRRPLRREFATQSDADYYRGLSEFLIALRRRPRFFRTDYFAKRYEAQAHANLDRLLGSSQDGTPLSSSPVTRPYLSSKRTMSSSSM